MPKGDKLFLPVDRLQGIHKFLGLEGQDLRLDRLGGVSWSKTKSKVRKAVEMIAQELVDLVRPPGDGQRLRLFPAAISFSENLRPASPMRKLRTS